MLSDALRSTRAHTRSPASPRTRTRSPTRPAHTRIHFQDYKECTLEDANGQPLLVFAQAYGFRNIQNIVQKVKRGRCQYQFVEVMACPSGTVHVCVCVCVCVVAFMRSSRLLISAVCVYKFMCVCGCNCVSVFLPPAPPGTMRACPCVWLQL